MGNGKCGSQQCQHVGIIHRRPLRLLSETALKGGFTIEGIDGEATQESQIVGSMQRADATSIFTKGDPVLTNSSANSGTIGR